MGAFLTKSNGSERIRNCAVRGQQIVVRSEVAKEIARKSLGTVGKKVATSGESEHQLKSG